MAGELNADMNNNEPDSSPVLVKKDKTSPVVQQKNSTASSNSPGNKKNGKISATGKASGAVKKKIIEKTTTSTVHTKAEAGSPAQNRDVASKHIKSENKTRSLPKVTGDKKHPVISLESDKYRNGTEHKRKAATSMVVAESSVLRKPAIEQRKEYIHDIQQTHGLSLNSRVVFFEESGVPLHGTIKYIGTISSNDNVIYAGIELVS